MAVVHGGHILGYRVVFFRGSRRQDVAHYPFGGVHGGVYLSLLAGASSPHPFGQCLDPFADRPPVAEHLTGIHRRDSQVVGERGRCFRVGSPKGLTGAVRVSHSRHRDSPFRQLSNQQAS